MLNLPPRNQNNLFRPSQEPSLAFSPIPVEDDELLRAIDAKDERWTLEQTPDTEALSAFWAEVQADLQNNE